MSTKGILSNIIITLLVVINVWMLIMLYSGPSPWTMMQDMATGVEHIAEPGMFSMLFVLLYGMFLAVFLVWDLSIAVVHTVCLVISAGNCRAERRDLRIWSYVLDAMNILLILASILLLFVWRTSS